MKLIDKLSYEYSKVEHGFGKETAQYLRQEAFEAGFKAAIALAAQLVSDNDTQTILNRVEAKDRYLEGNCGHITPHTLGLAIKAIGEEGV